MEATPSIRLANREDIPQILSMIRELATFENAASSVTATEESLESTLIFADSLDASKQGFAKTLLINAPSIDGSGEAVAGMALYFNNYSTWRSAPGIYLEDLFIRPAFRRRGYATMLLRELAREVLKLNGGRLEWSCLKWNEGALRFYKGLGAATMDEWVGLRVEGTRLEELAKREVDVGMEGKR